MFSAIEEVKKKSISQVLKTGVGFRYVLAGGKEHGKYSVQR